MENKNVSKNSEKLIYITAKAVSTAHAQAALESSPEALVLLVLGVSKHLIPALVIQDLEVTVFIK